MNAGNNWFQALGLPERQAVDAHLAAQNRLPGRLALLAATAVSFIGVLYQASENHWLRAGVWGVVLVALIGLYLQRGRPIVLRHARGVLLGVLAALPIVIALTVEDAMAGFVFAAILFPLTLLVFRFRGREILAMAVLFGAVSAWRISRIAATTDESVLPMIIIAPIWIGAAAAISNALSKRGQAAFLDEWRMQVRLAQEHARMRGELDDARTLQLGMLPSTLPNLPWLDISAICLPASEVGGDYYDVLTLDDGRLAVIVADVAGHGMSSGMVLASLRGGLYVLKSELDRPADALSRLSRMLRSVSGRMFVTAQLVILDPRTGDTIVVSAGHPPLVHATAAGDTDFVGKPAPPLGTALDAPPTEDHRRLEAGDTLVMYSDGLIEAVNLHDEALGFDRLAKHIGRLVRHGDVRRVRDGVLSQVASFKGDGEQGDDMTVVALRFLGPV